MSRQKRKKKNNNNLTQTTPKKHILIPRNRKQEELYSYLIDDTNRIVFALGPAGTGKTYLATLHAINLLKSKKISKITISRPAVENGEKHGFLPGDLTQKMEPWTRPIFDIFAEQFSQSEIDNMLKENILEISPLAYLRGRTFKDTTIILDESQNTTPSQMKMILTRLGENSRLFVTGDIAQTDIKSINGLADFANRLKKKQSDMIKICEFNEGHIERDPIVQEVLRIYS